MHPLIAPSILAANFGQLDQEIKLINESEADWIHCDVMDGVFVPNISFGLPIIKAVKQVAEKPLDVHLMIENPDRYIQAFKEAGADRLTVHLEATTHLDRTLNVIKGLGMATGVAINPATPVASLLPILPLVDTFLLMTVNPGFGGQSFIPYVLDKIESLRQVLFEQELVAHIEVDGGIDSQTGPEVVAAGADVLVAGSYVFKSSDPKGAIQKLKALEMIGPKNNEKR